MAQSKKSTRKKSGTGGAHLSGAQETEVQQKSGTRRSRKAEGEGQAGGGYVPFAAEKAAMAERKRAFERRSNGTSQEEQSEALRRGHC